MGICREVDDDALFLPESADEPPVALTEGLEGTAMIDGETGQTRSLG